MEADMLYVKTWTIDWTHIAGRTPELQDDRKGDQEGEYCYSSKSHNIINPNPKPNMAAGSSRWRNTDAMTENEREVLIETDVDFGPNDQHKADARLRRTRWIIAIILSVLLLAGLTTAIYFVADKDSHNNDHDTKQPYVFHSAAVAADTEMCSTVGRNILQKGGNAVDAALATLLCGGLESPQSMGIGGGFFMTIYNRTTESSTIVDAREVAPANATEDMYHENPKLSSEGALSIAVPGEIKGYWMAHQLHGSLSWQEIFEPSIKMAAEGFAVSVGLSAAIQEAKELLTTYPNFRSTFLNKETKELYKLGEIMTRPKLAETLRVIANEGPDAFYNGSLTDSLMKDLEEAGSIISRDDLLRYQPRHKNTLKVKLDEGHTILSPPPPSSGALLSFMLNILDGYDLRPEDIETVDKTVLTYHQIIEAFKFAYAKRTYLGDEEFVDVEELVSNLTSRDYANEIRSLITDGSTHNASYYKPSYYTKVKTSTSHLSVLDQHGSAVAVTSTINWRFGSHVLGSRTGIIFNNEMDDFSSPNVTNEWGVKPSSANFIKPGKKPLSSMCPAVIVDNNGDVVGVYGAAGGTKITTAVAWVITHARWLGLNIREAVELPRLHHQLLPPYLQYEESFKDQAVLDGLKAKGHEERSFRSGSSIVQSIQKCDGLVCAYSDPRKGGIPDGF